MQQRMYALYKREKETGEWECLEFDYMVLCSFWAIL